MTEDEMAGWHHQLNGREFEQALEDGERQGSLACCSPWHCKESDMTERLKNSNNKLRGHINMGIFSTSLINRSFGPSNPPFLKAGSSRAVGPLNKCLFQHFFLIFFWSHHVVCGILVPRPRIKPVPPA